MRPDSHIYSTRLNSYMYSDNMEGSVRVASLCRQTPWPEQGDMGDCQLINTLKWNHKPSKRVGSFLSSQQEKCHRGWHSDIFLLIRVLSLELISDLS